MSPGAMTHEADDVAFRNFPVQGLHSGPHMTNGYALLVTGEMVELHEFWVVLLPTVGAGTVLQDVPFGPEFGDKVCFGLSNTLPVGRDPRLFTGGTPPRLPGLLTALGTIHHLRSS